MTAQLIAQPLMLWPPAKVTYLLDRMVEHETWWSDFQVGRREIAAAILVNAENLIWEVWELGTEAQVVGIVLFTDVIPEVDAKGHFIFFDGKLGVAKAALLKNVMAWAFSTLKLRRISIEVPEFAGALAAFARKHLGFRFEAEGRIVRQRRAEDYGHIKRRRWQTVRPSAAQAELGSRKHRIVKWRGEWHDLLLLSVTAEEFEALWATSSSDQPPSKPSPETSADSAVAS